MRGALGAPAALALLRRQSQWLDGRDHDGALRGYLDVRIEPGQERRAHVKALGQLLECRHIPEGRQCLLLHHVVRNVVQERARHIGVRDGVFHERLPVRRTERFDSFRNRARRLGCEFLSPRETRRARGW